MKILIAAGSFKEGPSAIEVCNLIAKGINQLNDPAIEISICPLADGGTGLADLACRNQHGQRVDVEVSGPLPNSRTKAHYVVLPDNVCVLESASAAGLALIPVSQRDPLQTSTIGVGELVRHAFDNGLRHFILGCGDSATNDCGIGFAHALGVEFLDAFGSKVPPKGHHLNDIRAIRIENAREIINSAKFEVACNPNSILCGENGTTRKYAAQKGATPESIPLLEEGVSRFTELLEEVSNLELKYIPGGGGAGGLGGMIYALFNGELCFSFDIVRRFIDLDHFLKKADLVIVAEGLLDTKTLTGKLPCSVALHAKRYKLPVAAIVGGIEDDMEMLYYSGIDVVEIATKRPTKMQYALDKSEVWLPDAATRLIRKLKLGLTF